jgi:microcystin-dependent protein
VFTATEANQANELVSKYTVNGDIVVHGTTGPKTISTGGSGNNNKVLVADSTVTDGGVKWASIVADNIATGAVTSDKILNNTITLGDLATALQAFLVPVGTITAYGNATPPTGWLLCNGQSTSGYTALAAVVGATVPDLQGRTIIGTGSGTGLTPRTIKDTGGAETHILTQAETPAHVHTVNIVTGNEMSQHDHGLLLTSTPSGALVNATPASGAGIIATGSNTTSATTGAQNQTHQHTVFGNTGNIGSGNAHNNMQPYYALNYIIKHD